ncbi:TetR/AcrR family transcriptional regulator [Hyphomonas sp.]|uniref:TetR/AcrR family transcriptional regulator n=1 Tax=Hyphomonas sp. TaxID=87 RepID=UPI0035628D33
MTTRPRGRPGQDDADVVSDDVLLDAVLRAFGENGFDGTSVRDVARRLSISHNLIPQRFGSKSELWYAAVDYGFGRLDEELIREGKALGDDELVILRGLLVRVLELGALQPALLQIINQEASHPGSRFDYLFTHFIKPADAFTKTWLDSLAAQGRIRKPSPGLLYFLINHGAGSMFAFPDLAARLNEDGGTAKAASVREQAEMIVGILLDGMLPR